MKSIVAILLIMGLSLSLSAIELDDTFDEWDMVIKGCIDQMMEFERYLGKEAVKITEKAGKGLELTCQEKIILVLEAQKYVRGTVEVAEMYKENDPETYGNLDKEAIAWTMVREDGRFEELKNMKTRTGIESLELRAYYFRITKALKLFFPECYTNE